MKDTEISKIEDAFLESQTHGLDQLEGLTVREEIVVDPDEFASDTWTQDRSTPPNLRKVWIIFLAVFLFGFIAYNFLKPLPLSESLNNVEIIDLDTNEISLSNHQLEEIKLSDITEQNVSKTIVNKPKASIENNLSDSDNENPQLSSDSKAVKNFLAKEAVKVSNSQDAIRADKAVKSSKEAKLILDTRKEITIKPSEKLKVQQVEKIKGLKPSDPKAVNAKLKPNGNAAILNLPDSSYAIQLIGMNDLNGFEKYLNALPKDLNILTYQRIRKGKLWNVAILAPYKDAAAARKAITMLPTTLKADKPWIKSILSIKGQIK